MGDNPWLTLLRTSANTSRLEAPERLAAASISTLGGLLPIMVLK
jgi:hypothetical protein